MLADVRAPGLGSTRPTCLVVDPHPALAELVAAGLDEAGFEVVAKAATADSAVDAARELQPSVVVCDPRLFGSNGTSVLVALRAAAPATRIVAFADAGELGSAETVILAGVDAIVAKQSSLAELVRVATKAAAGQRHVGDAFQGEHREQALTTRERVTLRMLADGLGYAAIGARLGVAPETVRVHATSARKRLGAATRTAAVATALRQKLID